MSLVSIWLYGSKNCSRYGEAPASISARCWGGGKREKDERLRGGGGSWYQSIGGGRGDAQNLYITSITAVPFVVP